MRGRARKRRRLERKSKKTGVIGCAQPLNGSVEYGWDVRMRLFLFLLFCAGINLAYGDDQGSINELRYCELKKQFGHIVYETNESLRIYWTEDEVRERVKDHIEWSLLNLGTPEAERLLLQYRELDWDVRKMIDFHWSDPP